MVESPIHNISDFDCLTRFTLTYIEQHGRRQEAMMGYDFTDVVYIFTR